jgi:hypothetical protein
MPAKSLTRKLSEDHLVEGRRHGPGTRQRSHQPAHGAAQLPGPGRERWRTRNTALFTRLQSFPNVQAREFARHPDCSYRNELLSRNLPRPVGFVGFSIAFALALSTTPIVLIKLPATHWAAVAFTSAHISVRYLPEQRIY